MNGISLHLSPPTLSPAPCGGEHIAQYLDTFNMKAKICWENAEKSAIRYTFSGVWNWDDFYQILEQRDAGILAHDVGVIVDFRAITLAPSDAILHLKRAARMSEGQNNTIVVITNSATIVTLYHAFVTMYKSFGKRLRIVNTDAEAHAVLGIAEPD